MDIQVVKKINDDEEELVTVRIEEIDGKDQLDMAVSAIKRICNDAGKQKG